MAGPGISGGSWASMTGRSSPSTRVLEIEMRPVGVVPVGGAAGKPEAAAAAGFDRRSAHPELSPFPVREMEFQVDRERHPDAVVGRRHQGDVGQGHVRLRLEAEPELAAGPGDVRDRNGRVPAVAERAVMDEREVRQVDKILQPPPRGGRPGIGFPTDAAEGVAPGRASGNAGIGLRIEAQPDQIVGDLGLDPAQPEARRNLVIRHRGDFDARAVGVIEPAVVGAAQPARLHATDRQARRAMDAAVGKGRDRAADPGDGDRLAEQRYGKRPAVGRGVRQFRQRADRMPEIAPCAVVEIGHPFPPHCSCPESVVPPSQSGQGRKSMRRKPSGSGVSP